MKKILKVLTTTAVVSSLILSTGCANQNSSDSVDDSASNESGDIVEIIVGATSVPHAEILSVIQDDLEEEGVNLTIKEFTDYTLLNNATVEGSIDANYFQHTPYLDEFNANSDEQLVSVGPVHIEPLAVYSDSITSLDELQDGDKVSIPNDPTNEARALLLLEDNGIIKVDDRDSANLTPLNIVENSLNLEFVEMEAAQLPRTTGEVAMAVINTNYALEAGFDIADALAIENGEDSPYANILVVKEGDENKEEIQLIYEALTSDEVKEFIESNYDGAVIPAF